MKIKHTELEIPKDNPFQNCKLDRKRYAKVLTNVVNNYSDGFVLAINNEWGAGKTTFVKMWQQELKNEEFQTIYFNAWENDFDNNPLVAIMSELKTITRSSDKTYKSVLQKGAILTKNVAPEFIKSLLKRYAGIDENVIDAIKNTTEGITEILEAEIEEYATKKKTIIEFRDELEKFVKEKNNGKPLIFIIDELDRCRPNYAVEVLEQLKHFLSVPGIVFVLSIDKNHLASSVKGFYGSEHINTDEYLRRFIDLEYSIPKPSNKDFINYLYDYFSFSEVFQMDGRRNSSDFYRDGDIFLNVAMMLVEKLNPTLRQQEKIFGNTRLILSSYKENEYIFPTLLLVLVYLKTLKADVFKKIENNALTLQELSDVFTSLINNSFNRNLDRNILFDEALLLHFYNNNKQYDKRVKLYEKNNIDGVLTSPIKSKIEDENNTLAKCFESLDYKYNFDEVTLNHILKRIDLTDLNT